MPSSAKTRTRQRAVSETKTRKTAGSKPRAKSSTRAVGRLSANGSEHFDIMQSIGDGLITTDIDGRITRFNTIAEQLTGWSTAEAIGKPLGQVFKIVDSRTQTLAENLVTRALEQEHAVGLVVGTALVARNGNEYFISSSIAPIRDSANRILGIVIVFRDITDLKKAEDALKESQEYTQNLIDSSIDMIITTDRDRRIIEFNRAAQRTFGYAFEEVSGKDVSMLYSDADEMQRVHQSIFQDGKYVQEIRNRRKNGEIFTAFISASPLKNASGELIGYMGISRDITAMKIAEDQALRSERLRALGQMAAALAHEINNPLQAIQGILDLVIDFPIQAQERESNLRIVRQEIGRLSEVTERVLNFAHPVKVTCHPVAVEELIEQTLKLAGKHFQHAQVQIVTDIYLIPPVMVAPEQIVQVFLNLMLNAIEEMRDGGQLEISVRADEDFAAVGFKNDGPIIPEHVLSHIFEPFFTTKPEGSGLGLSVSQRIVQQQNGKITAENLGTERGVLFRVYLPLASSGTDV